MVPENNKKAINNIRIILFGINFDKYAPAMENKKEKIIIEIPVLKSRRLFFILLMLAPDKLMVL
jgi:hypothetical protein